MTNNKESKITSLVQSINNKIASYITLHNSSNSAHSSLFNNKADTNHTHSNMESRITALENELLDLEEDLLS